MSDTKIETQRHDAGVEANARLTASTGVVLLVLLAAEGVTLLSLGSLLRWHEIIGVLVIPPILLKLGTTGYRFVRYYTHDPRYRRKGPPHWVLRLTAPGMVALTVTLLVSGVLLGLDHHRRGVLFFVHKASFILWFAAMTVHVLGHVVESATVGLADWRPGAARLSGANVRRALLVGSLVAGGLLAAALASRF